MAETPIAQVSANVEATRAKAATPASPRRPSAPFQLPAWWYALVGLALFGLWLFPVLFGWLADAAGLPTDAQVYGDSHGIEALGMLVVFASIALPTLALAVTAVVLAFRHGRSPWRAALALKAWLLVVGAASLVLALLWTTEVLAPHRKLTVDSASSAGLLVVGLLVSALAFVPWMRTWRRAALAA